MITNNHIIILPRSSNIIQIISTSRLGDKKYAYVDITEEFDKIITVDLSRYIAV